jgi:hypothetical protein
MAATAKKKKTAPRAKAPAVTTTPTVMTYMLRTCASDMRSYGGFKWPASGKVECPDWNPRKVCGGGLHGLLHGKGDYGLVDFSESANWLVVAVDPSEVVAIDNAKVKVPRGEVVFCGKGADATKKLLELDPEAEASVLPFAQASASGDYGQASASGQRGQASASGY